MDRIDLASYRADSDPCPLVHVPDPATTLVWRTTADGHSALLVVGPRTHAAYHEGKDIPVCVRFRITTGAARTLLGTSVDEITDQVVPLGELWGPLGTRLADELAGLASQPTAVVDHLAAALSARVDAVQDQGSATADLVRRASVALSSNSGHSRPRVDEVARRVGVSERHLRNVFTTAVGIPPKQFVRLARIRTVLPGLRRTSWARLASDAGYYDQSHMVAQFREIMHVTPSAFAAGRLPTVPC